MHIDNTPRFISRRVDTHKLTEVIKSEFHKGYQLLNICQMSLYPDNKGGYNNYFMLLFESKNTQKNTRVRGR